MKYLLSRYTPNKATSYIITKLKSYRIKGNQVYGIIDKVIYKSKNYNRSRMPRYYKDYLPHKTRNGVYRIVGVDCIKANCSDELLEFNSDNEAILWFELMIKGEFDH